MKYLLLFISTLVIYLLLDGIWLGVIAKNFYKIKLYFILNNYFNYYVAIFFYVVYIVGLMHFVILPGITHQSVLKVFLNGAFFGFLCYATYDLTNMATIKQWPFIVTVVDILWGSLLAALVSTASYYVALKIF
ncbi:MAG: DUF2177 family protein [Chitinophagales bacterium]